MKIAYCDTETTGLYRHAGHEVWEVGLIVEEDGRGGEFVWQLPVDLGRADPMGLRIGGYYERRWSTDPAPGAVAALSGTRTAEDDANLAAVINRYGPHSRQAAAASGRVAVPASAMGAWADRFARLTVGAIWVGAVPSFDTGFLAPLLREHGACPGWHYQLVDVETLALGRLYATRDADDPVIPQCVRRDGSWDSNKLSLAVGVDPDQFDRHTALGDCRWARALHAAATAPLVHDAY